MVCLLRRFLSAVLGAPVSHTVSSYIWCHTCLQCQWYVTILLLIQLSLKNQIEWLNAYRSSNWIDFQYTIWPSYHFSSYSYKFVPTFHALIYIIGYFYQIFVARRWWRNLPGMSWSFGENDCRLPTSICVLTFGPMWWGQLIRNDMILSNCWSCYQNTDSFWCLSFGYHVLLKMGHSVWLWL